MIPPHILSDELQVELERLWQNYLIYASGTIKAGRFPAPFGSTQKEKDLREKMRESFHFPPFTISYG